MRRIASAAVSAVLSISGVLASPAIASTAHIWQVQAGSLAGFDAGGPTGGGNQFYPERIAIHAGDSINFTPVGPHTVTFNRPPVPVFALLAPPFITPSPATISSPTDSVSSPIGFDFPPQPYTLTFAASLPPGSYNIICGLHIGMSETVDVLAASAALPKTDADYAAIAQAEITRELNQLDQTASTAVKDNRGQDGDATVLVGAGNEHGSTIRFFPSALTIHVGQSVTFVKTKDPTEPHTVNFASPEDPFLELLPWGGATYPAAGFTASGLMVTHPQFDYYHLAGTGLPDGLLRYRLTFTAPGDFSYFCAIHDEAGMRATIHVVP
jgi:plastocyanin